MWRKTSVVYMHGLHAWSIMKTHQKFKKTHLLIIFLDQTQKTTQEILAGEDLRNSLDNHKQLEEVLSVMGKGLEIFDFRNIWLLRTNRTPCTLRRFISLNISKSCKCCKRISYWTLVQTIIGKENILISIYQLSMPSLAPSSHWEFSMSLFKLNVMRAPEIASILGIWGLYGFSRGIYSEHI